MIEAKEETGLKDGDHPEHQPGVTAVPFDLLRVGDLSNSMKTTQLTSGIGAQTRTRFAVDAIGDGPAGQQASCYYEVVGKTRQERPHLAPLQAVGSLGLDYYTTSTHLLRRPRTRAQHRLEAP